MAVRVGGARGRGRGRPTANAEITEEVRELRARMAAIELGRHPVAEDVSEPEDEEHEEEAAPMAGTPEMRCLRSILGTTSRPKPEFPTYEGSLTLNTSLIGLVSWTNTLSMMRLRRTRRLDWQ